MVSCICFFFTFMLEAQIVPPRGLALPRGKPTRERPALLARISSREYGMNSLSGFLPDFFNCGLIGQRAGVPEELAHFPTIAEAKEMPF